jgi:histidine triad (HIT) family protein
VTDDCIFCDIVSGRGPADVVGKNERALALMDVNLANDGHVLVISRAHAEDIWNLDVEDGRDVWALAMRIAHGIRDGLSPDGMTLFQANRDAGWQDVFHFHLHLVPRWDGDDLFRPWTLSAGGRDRISSVAGRIRAALA